MPKDIEATEPIKRRGRPPGSKNRKPRLKMRARKTKPSSRRLVATNVEMLEKLTWLPDDWKIVSPAGHALTVGQIKIIVDVLGLGVA